MYSCDKCLCVCEMCGGNSTLKHSIQMEKCMICLRRESEWYNRIQNALGESRLILGASDMDAFNKEVCPLWKQSERADYMKKYCAIRKSMYTISEYVIKHRQTLVDNYRKKNRLAKIQTIGQKKVRSSENKLSTEPNVRTPITNLNQSKKDRLAKMYANKTEKCTVCGKKQRRKFMKDIDSEWMCIRCFQKR